MQNQFNLKKKIPMFEPGALVFSFEKERITPDPTLVYSLHLKDLRTLKLK